MPNEHVSNPFVDFKYGDNYASDFHLIRTSDSKRYNDNLIPTLTDKTAEVPGADGMYFFNTYYKQRQFTLNLAYDSLTEEDLRAARNWLNGKDIKPLIFDERPDRQYYAKVTGTPQFKYIPFDQFDDQYKSSNINALYGLKFIQDLNPVASQLHDGNYRCNGQINGYEFTNIIFTVGTTTTAEFRDTRSYHIAYTAQWEFGILSGDSPEFEIYGDFDREELELFIDFSKPLATTHVVYKGEGSVQFTCYDPFAYSVESYQQGTEVQGELPAYFTVTKTGSIDIGEQWSVYSTESQTPIYTIQFTSNLTDIHPADYIVWDSRTGMIARYNAIYQQVHNPLSYVGQGMGTLEIGHTYTVSGNGQLALAYHNRYY